MNICHTRSGVKLFGLLQAIPGLIEKIPKERAADLITVRRLFEDASAPPVNRP